MSKMINTDDDREIKFTGKKCCVFNNHKTAREKLGNMPIIKIYGDTEYNEDKSVKHYLHTCDDGYRSLIRCQHCGAYFLVQKSEFHHFSGGDDSYYTDWFQVNDENHAELLNDAYDGYQIEREYAGPAFFSTNGEFNVHY